MTASPYERDLETLEAELATIERTFAGLTGDQWALSTHLQPLDDAQPRWTLLQLGMHFDISIGLTRMLVASAGDGQTGRDRISFFIFHRPDVAPTVYDYAVDTAAGKSPEDVLATLHETFGKTISEARAADPATVGNGYYALMRLDEFVASRIVEAVVHGIDLTDPLGRPCQAGPEAIATTAAILDELLARRTVAGRPAGLDDDVTWIRAASGRAPHDDPRLPLIG